MRDGALIDWSWDGGFIDWLVGIGIRFSLWVLEVPGSNPILSIVGSEYAKSAIETPAESCP